jgi:hypothetical protein
LCEVMRGPNSGVGNSSTTHPIELLSIHFLLARPLLPMLHINAYEAIESNELKSNSATSLMDRPRSLSERA